MQDTCLDRVDLIKVGLGISLKRHYSGGSIKCLFVVTRFSVAA